MKIRNLNLDLHDSDGSNYSSILNVVEQDLKFISFLVQCLFTVLT